MEEKNPATAGNLQPLEGDSILYLYAESRGGRHVLFAKQASDPDPSSIVVVLADEWGEVVVENAAVVNAKLETAASLFLSSSRLDLFGEEITPWLKIALRIGKLLGLTDRPYNVGMTDLLKEAARYFKGE